MKKDLLIPLIAFALVLGFCFAAWSRTGGLYPPIQSRPFASGTSKAAPAGKVVMKVNGEGVTDNEFNIYVAGSPDQVRQLAATPQGRKLVAEQIVAMKALEQQSHGLGLDVDSSSAAQMKVAESGVAASYALQKLIGTPSEAQLRQEYEKVKDQTAAPQVYHILFSCDASTIPPKTGVKISCAEAAQKAAALGTRIHSTEEFESAAKQFSDDVNSAPAGGSLGNFRQGMFPPEIEQVLSRLTPGQVSPPVRTAYGYHLFLVGKPQPAPFEQVRAALENQWKQERIQTIMREAGTKAKVDYDPAFFGTATTSQAPVGSSPRTNR